MTEMKYSNNFILCSFMQMLNKKKTYGTINIKIDKVESQEKHAVSKLGWFRIRHTKDIKLSCGWF